MRISLVKSVLPIAILMVIFIFSAYVAQTNEDYFMRLVGKESVFGILIYIVLAIFTTVIAPLSSVPLMPIASNIWGWPTTAIASIAGWWIGSLIAFYLSRKYGQAFVERMISREKLSSFEKRVPEKNIFWSIVLLRMLIPVDVLSYVLGLFTKIAWRTYALASLIGIIPFAFIFAYIGTLPFK